MAKIVKKRYAGIEPVYNMEVFGLHNYITPLGSILHNCRYFCVSRVLEAEGEKDEKTALSQEEDEFVETDYETYMCGGDMTQSYIGFAG